MPLQMENNKLDEDLNRLGDIWTEKSAELADSGVDFGPHRPFMVGKEVAKAVNVALTANFMLKAGIAQKQVRA